MRFMKKNIHEEAFLPFSLVLLAIHAVLVEGSDTNNDGEDVARRRLEDRPPWDDLKVSTAVLHIKNDKDNVDEGDPGALSSNIDIEIGYSEMANDDVVSSGGTNNVDEDDPWAATQTANGFIAVSLSEIPNDASSNKNDGNEDQSWASIEPANGLGDDKSPRFQHSDDGYGTLNSPNSMANDLGSLPDRNGDNSNENSYLKSSNRLIPPEAESESRSSNQESLVNRQSNPSNLPKWKLVSMDDSMAIANVANDHYPFGIVNDAPDHSFFIDQFGNVGLGTHYPKTDLHVVSKFPTIRLQDDISGERSSSTTGIDEKPKQRAWDILGSRSGFSIFESTLSPGGHLATPWGNLSFPDGMPFHIESGAPTFALVVDRHGRVGFGTDSPLANLHVMGSTRIDGTFQVVGGVEGSCVLDTHSCQFKRQFRRKRHRRRNMMGRGVEGQEEGEEAAQKEMNVDEENEQNRARDKYLELLQKQNLQVLTTNQALHERLELLEERIQTMEAMITDLLIKPN